MASAISCFQLFTAVLLRPNWLFCNRKDHFPMLVFHGEFTTEGLWWYVLLVTCEVYLSYCLPNIYSFFFFFPQISILNILPQESFSWGLEFLEHTVILCLTLRKCWAVCTVAVPFYIPTSSVWGFYFIHILSDIGYFLFFWYSHLSECEVVYLYIVVWISNSLMTNNVKHNFVCFLVIYISSFEKHLSNSVAHFLIDLCLWVVKGSL